MFLEPISIKGEHKHVFGARRTRAHSLDIFRAHVFPHALRVYASSLSPMTTHEPDEELADIAKEDRNLMDIMVSGEESGRGGRRGSSVNASRQRSSRSQSSRANSLSPGPTSREEGSGKRRAEREASPSAGGSKQLSRGRSNSTRSLSSNSLSLQPLEEKRACPNESTNSSSTSTPGSRERPFFPYTRRSSQIRPLLSSIEASGRAASEEQRGARVALDDVTSAKDTLVDPQ